MASVSMLRNFSSKFTPILRSQKIHAANGLFWKSQLHRSESRHYYSKEVVRRCNTSINLTSFRYFSENPKSNTNTESFVMASSPEGKVVADDMKNTKMNIFKRLVLTVQSYGIVFIVMVVVTGVMWFFLFYMAANQGINIIPLLNYLHCPAWILNSLSTNGVGELATAYLLYKLISPVRYYVTFKSTKIVTKKLQDMGYLSKVSEENKIRNLAKEGRELSKQILTDRKNQSTKKFKEVFGKKWDQH